MQKWIIITCLVLANLAQAKEAPKSLSLITPELQKFLPPPPVGFQANFLKPAQKLRSAIERKKNKSEQAIKELIPLATNGEYQDHASYELALLYREKKDFAKSLLYTQKILFELPPSSFQEQIRPLLLENRCALALKNKRKQDLLHCLQNTPWKEWVNRESQTEALYQLLKSSKDPLLGPFVAEASQALPTSSPLRSRFAKELPDNDLRKYSKIARFRINTQSPSGVKATYPDLDLFDLGMQNILEEKNAEANANFKKLVAEYPQSEHGERARYWIARTAELMGNHADAKERYEQILKESPLNYYGLQSALHLGRDMRTFLVPSEFTIKPMGGMLLTSQARSFWKLQALLEVGLLDQAREEAEFLFQNRPGSFTFGQDSAEGALLVGLLYQTAGYHLAAFSHAYAATNLDPSQLALFAFDLIFPHVYLDEFNAAAEETNINPLLLLSLTKQESAFIPNALSRADAYGLMQLLFPTAKEVDEKISKEQLFEPSKNIRAGSRYLQKLLDRYQGNLALALAGYNAGPNRASQWQKKLLESELMKKNFDIEIFIETIPFTETRKYVGSILRNFAWYKLLNKDGTISSIQELANQWQKNLKQTIPETKIETAPKELEQAPVPAVPAAPTAPSTPSNSDTSAPTAGS